MTSEAASVENKDSYRDSLIYTNIELTRLFGNGNRFVPAHMPHLLNKHVLNTIEKNMSFLINTTIHHRFRDSTDLQYSFLYFHYLYHLKLLQSEDPFVTLWKRIDSDGNNVLNENELQTLNTMCFDDSASRE